MHSLPDHPPQQRSYLLRCTETRSSPGTASLWRFILQETVTGEQHGFADAEALLAYLRTQLTSDGQEPRSSEERGS
jgi:hypothetical protein